MTKLSSISSKFNASKFPFPHVHTRKETCIPSAIRNGLPLEEREILRAMPPNIYENLIKTTPRVISDFIKVVCKLP